MIKAEDNFIIYEKENKTILSNADAVFKAIKKINIDYEQENFIVFYLNTRNGIIKEEALFKGGINACFVCPNTIFKKALLNNSPRFIVAHNHPSDDLTASYEDIELMKELKKMGEILNIKVLDGVIFNKKGYYSIITNRNNSK